MSSLPQVPPGRSRLVILGAAGPHRTEDAIARAARRLGLEARVVDVAGLRRRLGPLGIALATRRVEAFDPDVVLCSRHAHHLGKRLELLFRDRFAAVWYFDAVPRAEVVAMARLAGRMFVTYRSLVAAHERDGVARVRFLPQGVDPDRDRPATEVRSAYRCDASFVGSGPYPHRWPLLRAVAAACRLQIRGPGWRGAPADLPVAGGPVHGDTFAEVVGGALVNLGASALATQETEHGSASNRMWKVMGCGGFYLGPLVPGIEAFARDREHCRWYRSTEEAVAVVREALADPAGTARLAAAGRAHALAEHTYDARLARLLADEGWPA